jgi:ribosome-associated heat shock protein Hsp15
VGDRIAVRRSGLTIVVEVLALSTRRGPAVQAQTLYRETAESRAERERLAESRRMAPDPVAAQTQGRPTKRDRRDLADWQRWSASSDD